MALQPRIKRVLLLALGAHRYVAVEAFAHGPLLPLFTHVTTITAGIFTEFTEGIGDGDVLGIVGRSVV